MAWYMHKHDLLEQMCVYLSENFQRIIQNLCVCLVDGPEKD